MENRNDSILAIVAAIFVLFTAMFSPVDSTVLAVALLVAFAVYKLTQSRKHPSR